MNRKIFTANELVKIWQNPYVKSATLNSIRFTIVFKEEFWQQYEKGISPANIMKSMGFDPDVLGSSRILGIVRHIKEQLKSEKGLRDVYQRPLPDEEPGKSLPQSKTLLHMQHLYEAGVGIHKKNYLGGQGGRAEMLIQSKPEIKFGIIREMTSRDNNILNIS